MTHSEFSDTFDVLVRSTVHNEEGLRTFMFDEYEKSVFLTKAQDEIFIALYTGKGTYEGFESTEELRRYLDSLNKTKTYTEEDRIEDQIGVSTNSIFYELPEDLAFITMEQVTYADETLDCYDGSTASVYPVTQDEYSTIKGNPFRGPTKYKVIRLDHEGNMVELISKYNIGTYLLKYLTKPKPIILDNLPEGLSINGYSEITECELRPTLHNLILNRAVQLALQSQGTSENK